MRSLDVADYEFVSNVSRGWDEIFDRTFAQFFFFLIFRDGIIF